MIGTESKAQAIDLIAKGTGDLPAFPAIAMEAMRLTEDPKVRSRDLEFVIAKDQALTARMLKIVNSAMYCFQSKVSTISHAISILGLDSVRSIILTASVQQAFQSPNQKGADLSTSLLWKHSWGAAIAARAVGVCTKQPIIEECFTGGLLHDIGKLVLLKNHAREYSEVIEAVYRDGGLFHDAEFDAFGFNHSDVGAYIAREWRFPRQLVEAIQHHHNFETSPSFHQLAAVICLANRIMALLGIGFVEEPDLDLTGDSAVRFLDINPAALQELIIQVQMVLKASPGID